MNRFDGPIKVKESALTVVQLGPWLEEALILCNDGGVTMAISNGNNRPDKKVVFVIGLEQAIALGITKRRPSDHPEEIIT